MRGPRPGAEPDRSPVPLGLAVVMSLMIESRSRTKLARMERSGLFYVRFMDDILVLSSAPLRYPRRVARPTALDRGKRMTGDARAETAPGP